MAFTSSSTTSVIEMEPIRLAPSPKSTGVASSPLPQELMGHNEATALAPGSAPADEDDELPPPSTATNTVQRWNYPRSNIPKVAACFWSFAVMGANDAAYGALIHYIEQYYNLTYLIVSLIFLSPFVGYTTSAFMNNWIHHKFGQRGVAFIGPVCHLVAYLMIALHPPYPVLVVAFMIAGYGNGLADAAWNAWIGSMANANEILGFLHGLYGLGAVISPLVATSMVTKANLEWYSFYYLMISFAVLESVALLAAFWNETATVYKESISHSGDSQRGSLRDALTKSPSARVTWLCALFLLGYVGIEVALGGWIVVFMIQVRHGEAFASGMTATGFWLGLAIGRLILGFVTPRIGEKTAISIYLPIAMGLELLFWLVPQFIVSAVAIALQGFFLGPLFPAAIVAMSKLLPRHLHVGAIGFAAAFGGSGAAVLPFAVGAIAQAKGVQVLQPIIMSLLGVILMLWLGLPRFGKKKEMWGRMLLTFDAIGLVAGTLKADYFSTTHMYNPNWPPHAKFHNAQTVGLAVTLGFATLYYAWRRAASPQMHREYMRMAAFLGSIYWITGLLSFLPEGTMGVDPEFGGPGHPQLYVFTPFLASGLVGAWLEY